MSQKLIRLHYDQQIIDYTPLEQKEMPLLKRSKGGGTPTRRS